MKGKIKGGKERGKIGKREELCPTQNRSLAAPLYHAGELNVIPGHPQLFASLSED